MAAKRGLLRALFVVAAVAASAGGQTYVGLSSEIFGQGSPLASSEADLDSNPPIFGDPIVPGVTARVDLGADVSDGVGGRFVAATGGTAAPGGAIDPIRLGAYAEASLVGADGPDYKFATFGVSTTTHWTDVVTVAAADPVYLVPTFHLTGTLTATGDETVAMMRLSVRKQGDVSWTMVREVVAPTDGSLVPIDEMVGGVALALDPGVPTQVDVFLTAHINIPNYGAGTPMLPFDGSADVDFSATAELVSLALYADPGLTMLLTDGVSVSSDGLFDLGSILVPEPASLSLLALAAAVGLVKKRCPRARRPGRS